MKLKSRTLVPGESWAAKDKTEKNGKLHDGCICYLDWLDGESNGL